MTRGRFDAALNALSAKYPSALPTELPGYTHQIYDHADFPEWVAVVSVLGKPMIVMSYTADRLENEMLIDLVVV